MHLKKGFLALYGWVRANLGSIAAPVWWLVWTGEGRRMPNSSLSKIPVAVCSRYFFGRSYSVGYGLLFGGLRITTMEYFA
jgi:hypothetical protein